VPVSIPNSKYTMSCYSILTSCEVASNFSRFDGIRFGHHTNLDFSIEKSDKLEYNFEKIITKNRNESLGKVVKSRIVSGNYFLLKE
jgi:aspartyl-tRNA(Asn)/glutamyl-tRNA(Gln) amidotransferase subunit A